jgi:mercuric reductase
MAKYELIILGGGAGAFAAAIKANELGVNAALINDGLPLGGTCVNVGCVPSKTLLHAAELLHIAKHHNVPGIELTVNKADFSAVVSDEMTLVEQLRVKKYEQVLESLSNLTFIKGRASFLSERKVRVGKQELDAAKFIIATGSKAIVPEIDGLIEAGYITHVEAMAFKSVPGRLAVIGAGAVGLELAQMYSRFGSQVTVLQRANRIIPNSELELTEKLHHLLEDEGIKIETGVRVTKVATQAGVKTLFYNNNTGERSVVVDQILVAAGKLANSLSLNLESAGVVVDRKGRVVTEITLQTSQPHIYAVGDVTNLPLRLETTAGREGTYAAENILTGTDKSINYDAVPYTIFTDPQLASVGYTEERQIKEFKSCACRTITFNNLSKALIIRRTEGAIKMAIHPETKAIMGVHILAPNAGDLIAQAMVLIENVNTIDDVVATLPVFPTMAEALKLVSMSFTKELSQLSCCI